MNREPDFDGGSNVGDGSVDEFEAIISVWRAEGRVPEWPADAPTDPTQPVDVTTQPTPAVTPAEPPTSPQPVVADDQHFIPPEPPPLPRIGPPALVGAALLALGIILVTFPGWLGLSDIYGLPLGLISLAAGLGWLVLRLWPDSLSATGRDEDDDGAVL